MRYLRAVSFCLSTLVLYLGLPVLGWGVSDPQGFFSCAPRLGYAALVAVFGLAVGWQALGGSEGIRGGRGQESKRVRRQSIVRFAMVLLLYATLVFLPFADRRGVVVMAVGAAVRWAGLGLAVLGFTLVFWSGVALGRQYSPEVTIQKDHHLVTTGPYRYIRHPRYLGVILLAIGLSLLYRSWLGLAASIPIVVVLLARIRDEEALMRHEFGEEWEAYCRRSRRLLPGIY